MSESSSPASELACRVRDELATLFDPAALISIGLVPQTADVIGGLLAGHGGSRCLMPVSRYALALAQKRSDGQALIFDFGEYDQHRPFTLQMPIDALRRARVSDLKTSLSEPGRSFAEPGIAAARALLDHIAPPSGFNLVFHRSPEFGSALADSLAAVATLQEVLELPSRALDPLAARLVEQWEWPTHDLADIAARLASNVSMITADDPTSLSTVSLPDEAEIVVAPLSSQTNPAELQKSSVAARMAHRMILEKMRAFGHEAKRELLSDPMEGHLGNLAMSDYKRFFRGTLPESIRGSQFIERFGDGLLPIEREIDYAPQLVADHLVIEAHRAREWARHLREASAQTDHAARKLAIDKAGHLMYASHKSARDNCGIGSDLADRWVAAARANESAGIYGARMSADAGFIVYLCRKDVDWSHLCARGVLGEPKTSQLLRLGRGAAACRSSFAEIADFVQNI